MSKETVAAPKSVSLKTIGQVTAILAIALASGRLGSAIGKADLKAAQKHDQTIIAKYQNASVTKDSEPTKKAPALP